MPAIVRMMTKGTRVVYRPVGETSGIYCNKAMKRKKALAALLICSYRNRGRNVNTLYLAVLIRLSQNLLR